MEQTFNFRLGRSAIYGGIAHLILLGIAIATITYLYQGGYILAWSISILVALVLLLILSIPRRAVLTDHALEIHCISERTTLHYENIANVARIPRHRLSLCLPLAASFGFFGYYGIYFDLRQMEIVRLYCSQWSNIIQITDIEGRRYYIASDMADTMVGMLTERITPRDIRENI